MSPPKTNTPTYVTVLRDPNNKTSYVTQSSSSSSSSYTLLCCRPRDPFRSD